MRSEITPENDFRFIITENRIRKRFDKWNVLFAVTCDSTAFTHTDSLVSLEVKDSY